MRDVVLELLRKYLDDSIKITGSGNAMLRCPFHKDGMERKPSFSVSLEKGIFNCFTCHESGDIRKLLIKLKVPPARVAMEVDSIKGELDKNRELQEFKKDNFHVNRDPFLAVPILPESMLGLYQEIPDSLVSKGFDPTLLKSMGIGVNKRDNRIMYPIRDVYGNLAGFSGGTLDKDIYPKYKVYTGATAGATGDFGPGFDELFPGYKFRNHDYLWNAHNVWAELEKLPHGEGTLYITEGFKACLWMLQHGYRHTVALMGTAMSETQQRLIHRLGVNVVLCLDNDKPGRSATLRIGRMLFSTMGGRVRVANYPEIDDNTQLDDYHERHLPYIVSRLTTPYLEFSMRQRALRGNTNGRFEFQKKYSLGL